MQIDPERIVITRTRLVLIVVGVWVTTILAATGVSYIAAGISAGQSSKEQCLSRQAARETTIRNTNASRRFYRYERNEANRQITVARTQGGSPAAQATIKRNEALLANIPDIEIPPKIDCA